MRSSLGRERGGTAREHRRTKCAVGAKPGGVTAPSAGFAGAIPQLTFPGGGREECAVRRATTVGRGAEPPSELNREGHREPAARADLALHRQSAAVSDDDGPRDGEPEP